MGSLSSPSGGLKPAGFSSETQRGAIALLSSYPVLAEDQRQAGTLCGGCASPAECPCGGRKPFGFSSRCETCPDLNPIPILVEESAAGRQNTVMWRLCFPFGRAMPPHDGILPAVTMPDWG
ncbi:MAG: hypothetical protein LBK61_02705, partial [Spirochaetaceae bacterium]|nr:hypothetical protein [Spirochaetaceae bacterium]